MGRLAFPLQKKLQDDFLPAPRPPLPVSPWASEGESVVTYWEVFPCGSSSG